MMIHHAQLQFKGLDTAAYNASKSAIVQLGRSLAGEWGAREGQPQIRVNTLSPGYIKTALTANDMLIPGRERQWSSENMLNRLSYPDEYRGPAMFLLSDASSFMTGIILQSQPLNSQLTRIKAQILEWMEGTRHGN